MCCFTNKEHGLKCQYFIKSRISGLDFKSSQQEHFVVMIPVRTIPAAALIQHSTLLLLYKNGFLCFYLKRMSTFFKKKRKTF